MPQRRLASVSIMSVIIVVIVSGWRGECWRVSGAMMLICNLPRRNLVDGLFGALCSLTSGFVASVILLCFVTLSYKRFIRMVTCPTLY